MEKLKIKNYIREIISELLEMYENFDENENLVELGMESVKFVELILQIEEHFNIQIPDEKLNFVDMNTLKNIVAVVSKRNFPYFPHDYLTNPNLSLYTVIIYSLRNTSPAFSVFPYSLCSRLPAKVVRSHLPYQGSIQINGAPLPAGDHRPNNGASKLTVR